MDFGWDAETSDLYKRTEQFCERHLKTPSGACSDELERERWRQVGAFGLLGLTVPVEYGGLGLDALTACRAMEAFGHKCLDTGFGFGVAAHLFAGIMPIVEFGTELLKASVLPELVSGARIAANAMTEPDAGSDILAIKSVARREGDCYVLDGLKSFVTNGPLADSFIVYAKTASGAGFFGLSAFVVERTRTGIVVGKDLDAIGLRGARMSAVQFDGCSVPVTNMLGQEGMGAAVFQQSMRWERACLTGLFLGLMERTVERCLDHARSRRQSGIPIGFHQAVSHRVVDMRQRLEAARLMLYRACWLLRNGHDAVSEIAMAKIAVSEAAVQCGLDAIQIFGADGVVTELGVEQLLRDAIPSRIFSGTSDIQRNIVAAELGLAASRGRKS